MKCPTDGSTLLIADRNGIEIDYCPQCRGVWLDRGELDKIIERSVAAPPPPPPPAAAAPYDDGYDEAYDTPDRSPRGKRKKRGGFLSEVFDFLD